VLIRPAIPFDAPAIARIHVETWQAAYRGQIPDALLDGLDVAQRSVTWAERLQKKSPTTFVAEEEKEIIGFGSLMPCHDNGADPKQNGDIVALYVLPKHWRRGAGRLLTTYAFTAAREAGYSVISLWVLTSNTPSRKFYEAMGFAPDGATKLENRHGAELHETRYRRSL